MNLFNEFYRFRKWIQHHSISFHLLLLNQFIAQCLFLYHFLLMLSWALVVLILGKDLLNLLRLHLLSTQTPLHLVSTHSMLLFLILAPSLQVHPFSEVLFHNLLLSALIQLALISTHQCLRRETLLNWIQTTFHLLPSPLVNILRVQIH